MNHMMKSTIFQMLALVAVTPPLMAIEPPVEVAPVPPSKPPVSTGADQATLRSTPRAVEIREPEQVAEAPKEGQPYLGVVLADVPEFLTEHLQLEPG